MTEFNLGQNINMDVGSKSPTYQRVYSPHKETKICIIVDSKTPTILKVPVEPGRLTLGQFKNLAGLNEDHYKFYFKSHDSEFGMVKEELVEDDSTLPTEDGKIVVWVISNDSVQYSLFDPNNRHEQLQPPLNSDDIDWYQTSFSQSPMLKNPQQLSRVVVPLYLDSQSTLGLTVLCPDDDLCQIGGIQVDKIQHNSVASRDGRFKPGDKIVEINGKNLTCVNVSQAITIFKECVDRKGAINIVLERARNEGLRSFEQSGGFDQSRGGTYSPAHDFFGPSYVQRISKPRAGFDPATELPAPVIDSEPMPIPKVKRALPNINHRSTYSLPRSITPRSWYTTSNIDNFTTSSELHHPLDSRSVYEPTTPNSLRKINVALHCGKDNVYTIYEAMRADSASLDIRDRDWLKVVVKDAFLGSTLIKWLSRNVYGFCNRSEIKRFANQMLSLDLIKSPVSNSTFSEKCYYTLT